MRYATEAEAITSSQPAAKRRPAPAKRWKGAWRSGEWATVVCVVCKRERVASPGMRLENHCLTFPSADLAETWFREQASENAEWIEAFPADEEWGLG